MVMLIIVSICSVFVYLFIQHTQQTLDWCVESKIESIRAIVKTLEIEKKRHYRKRINSFINYKLDPSREKNLQAFAAQDREELLRLSTPYFNLIQSEDPSFSTLAWILPDNHNLLRVHNPKRTIDDVSKIRPDVVKANRDHQQYSGYILAKAGIRYAIVEPVLYKGSYLGVVQFGLDESFPLETIKEQLHLIVGLIIPNEKFSVVTRAKLPSITGKKYTIQSHDLTFFEKGNDVIDWSLEQQQVLLHGKRYVIVKALNLTNYADHVQGQIFAVLDISEHVADADTKTLYIFILGTILLLSSFVILYFSYGSLVERIITLNRSLRQKTKEWENTFDAMSDIVTLQDIDMNIFKVNQAGCNALGLKYDNIIGKHCYELFHGSNEPCPKCPLLVTRETFEPYTKEITHEKLGKTFLVSASPVINEDGKLTHIAHVAKDITEKKKIEERLFLNEKLSTIAGLAAGVAHEINNPLSAILNSQQIIEMGLDHEKPTNKKLAEECGVDLAKVETYFEKKNLNCFMKGIRDSAIKAGNIINNLLNFSRPHKGDITHVNLSNLLDTTLLLASVDYDLKKQYDIIKVKILKEYDSELNEVPCVAMEIEQVILNLIKNAVHAMADHNTEDPYIMIRTAKMEDMARIEVEDNGPGIDKETHLHIFDPFFTTKEVGMGTGLGLSVSHALIADKHRGNIWVESEPGKGAKFIIELPLNQEV